ncbi:hypothetical protein ACFL38_00815 [Candidatus Omnitrophota bacterium]
MAELGKFKLMVMNPDRLIFQGEISNAFFQGDSGEYEIMSFHYPVLGLLREGRIIIDWKYYIPVKKGVVKFFQNDCVALIELAKG